MANRRDVLSEVGAVDVPGGLQDSLRWLLEAAHAAGYDTTSPAVQVALIASGTQTHLGVVAERLGEQLISELRRWRTGVR